MMAATIPLFVTRLGCVLMSMLWVARTFGERILSASEYEAMQRIKER